MPVVINRSSPSGGGSQPDKNGGKKSSAAAKPVAKKKAKGADSSPFDDPRIKIGALAGLIVIAILVVLFSMGYFSGSTPAPVTAPPPGPAGAAGGTAGTGPGARSGPGVRPGAPIPGNPGDDTDAAEGGARLPKGSGL